MGACGALWRFLRCVRGCLDFVPVAGIICGRLEVLPAALEELRRVSVAAAAAGRRVACAARAGVILPAVVVLLPCVGFGRPAVLVRAAGRYGGGWCSRRG